MSIRLVNIRAWVVVLLLAVAVILTVLWRLVQVRVGRLCWRLRLSLSVCVMGLSIVH